MSFTSGSKEERRTISLKNILKEKAPSAGSLQTRFNFGSPRSVVGASCVTPLQEAGRCSYISDSLCRPVLTAVIRHGVTPSILKYLLAAIKKPPARGA